MYITIYSRRAALWDGPYDAAIRPQKRATNNEQQKTNNKKRTTKKALANASAFFLISGFLSSQGASPQVLSVFAGLTAVFGMGTGGSPQLSPLNYVIQDFRILTTA